MALDGAFLRHLKKEMEQAVLQNRVDKIYQPNRDEIILFLRSRDGVQKLLLSSRADSARLHLIHTTPENPKYPPMLCMLLRKRLTGARLVQIRQPNLERVLLLDFDATNELGDPVRLTLAVEIMGRYSNVIFLDQDGKIIDALKRVNAEMSSERLVLPGLTYRLPPPQNKLCLLDASPDAVLERMLALPGDMELQKAVLRTLQGVSPGVCREIQDRVSGGTEITLRGMETHEQTHFLAVLTELQDTVRTISGKPYLAQGPERPIDFSFLPIAQYGTAAHTERLPSFSALLDAFYGERDRIDRMRVKSQDLLRILTTASERLSRKINNQRAELESCSKREEWRVCGDLLNANLYRIEKGASSVTLENFYEPGQPPKSIRLDPALSPSQNAQKYYKAYRKARTAEDILAVQIAQANNELRYLDTVFEELARAATERDLGEIRAELAGEGYIRRSSKGRTNKEKSTAPLQFRTSDGYLVLVGRNNRQNDQLTLHQAHKNDMWFHTQKIPGSHVILVTDGRVPTETAIDEAAQLAAFHSRGRDSSQVPVDYTLVRHVNKPQGAKPGMVIYVSQKTRYVTPDKSLVEMRKAP